MDKVVHFEIPAEDTKRAQEFYEKTFAWHIIPMPAMHYTMVHTGPTNDKDGMVQENAFINGGLTERSDWLKNPVLTINVDSIEEASPKITANGGEVIQGKQSVGDMGFTAYFKDTEGNVLGLWENVKK